jgi:hypothetical protein
MDRTIRFGLANGVMLADDKRIPESLSVIKNWDHRSRGSGVCPPVSGSNNFLQGRAAR